MKQYPELPRGTIQQLIDEKYGEKFSRKVIDIRTIEKQAVERASAFDAVINKGER